MRHPTVRTVLVFIMVFGVLLLGLAVFIGLGQAQLVVIAVLALAVTAWLKPTERPGLPPPPQDSPETPYDPGSS